MHCYKFLVCWWIWGLLCMAGGYIYGMSLVRHDVAQHIEKYVPELNYLMPVRRHNRITRLIVHLKTSTMEVKTQKGGYSIPIATGATGVDERTGQEMSDYSGGPYTILRKQIVAYGNRQSDGEFVAAPYALFFEEDPFKKLNRSIHEGELTPSHGCVVVPYAMGKMLFALADIGTPLEFRDD